MAQAPHPRMHGLTHVKGGSDPVPFLPGFPAGDTLDEKLAAAGPAAWWKLDETTGTVAHDSSGNGHDLAASSPYVPPLWGQPVGPPGTTTARWVDDSTRLSSSTGAPLAGYTDNFTAGVWVNADTNAIGELVGQGTGGYHGGGGWALLKVVDGLGFKFAVGVAGTILYGNNRLAVGGAWYFVACVRDAGTWRLYINGLLQASTITTSPGSVAGSNTWLGNDAFGSHGTFLQAADLSYAFIVDRPMSGTELEDLVHAADTAPVTDHTGWVLTADENGNPVWAEPTVEVTGGGINVTPPDDTPVDSTSSYGGTPTTPSGWHLDAHFETVILHDSTRGRFDVPTMKWTRVPFNAIRISRTWEPTVGSPVVKTALLPDDRGLTGPARDGILHVNADMVWASPQTVGGWFSIEYPVLEPGGLPDDDPEVPGDGPRPEAPRPGDPIAAPDTYMRAARMMNVSQGYVLRMTPGSATRAIRGWGFQDTADGIGDSPHTDLVDNPFPTYPIWAARPLHMLPPYPQMSPTESKAYYVNYQGDPGFRFDDLQVETDLAAGANLCLQAWQDSPWLIRFSTDRFPAYHGYTSTYRGYPYLQITFSYDPDTIDHTTGKLLLPAPA